MRNDVAVSRDDAEWSRTSSVKLSDVRSRPRFGCVHAHVVDQQELNSFFSSSARRVASRLKTELATALISQSVHEAQVECFGHVLAAGLFFQPRSRVCEGVCV